jgi:hypothetical protein
LSKERARKKSPSSKCKRRRRKNQVHQNRVAAQSKIGKSSVFEAGLRKKEGGSEGVEERARRGQVSMDLGNSAEGQGTVLCWQAI